MATYMAERTVQYALTGHKHAYIKDGVVYYYKQHLWFNWN